MSLGAFRDFYGQTITIAPATGRDSYGELTFGSAVAYKSRIVGKRRLVRSDQGVEVLSTQTCYLFSNANISTKDKCTLSTGFVGSTEAALLTPGILEVGRYPDETGRVFYTALYLG